jgi:hypothetical protein
MVTPLIAVALYAFFLLCATAPISELSIEKAGQFGDSFGVITSLFSGFAFSGVLITLILQRDELKLQRQEIERSKSEQAQNERLNALAALLSVYHELADKKQTELDSYLLRAVIRGSTGKVQETLETELASIRCKRNKIYDELEKAAGLE